MQWDIFLGKAQGTLPPKKKKKKKEQSIHYMSSIQNALHILKKSAHMGSSELLWRPVLKAKKNKQG